MIKHFRTFMQWLRDGHYTYSDKGIILGNDAIVARGVYHPFIDGERMDPEHNLLPLEGLAYFLSVGIKSGTAEANWYLALSSGNTNPASTWTAANYASNASEITSTTEGYSEATRPAWVPGTISSSGSSSTVGNLSSLASYSIVCTTNISIAGAAVLSSDVRGGTAGTLLSATRFGSPHTVNNGSTFELGYEIELTDSA